MTDARTDAVDGKIAELRTLVEREVLPLIQWYQRKKRWPRRLHRLSGVLVIALGATIPLLSAYSASPPTRIVVGTAGAVITVITGLATVYEWQKTWRIFTVAQAELETERLAWFDPPSNPRRRRPGPGCPAERRADRHGGGHGEGLPGTALRNRGVLRESVRPGPHTRHPFLTPGRSSRSTSVSSGPLEAVS